MNYRERAGLYADTRQSASRTRTLAKGKSPGVVGFRSPGADGAGCSAGVSLTVPGWAIA